MSGMFSERERAAENLFAHDEEMRFLVRRRAIAALGSWAAAEMSLEPELAAQYMQDLVDRFVSGASEERLAEAVSTDLEDAGKPALSTHVGTVFEQAVADASLTVRGASPGPAQTQRDPRTEWAQHHPKPKHSWGWGL